MFHSVIQSVNRSFAKTRDRLKARSKCSEYITEELLYPLSHQQDLYTLNYSTLGSGNQSNQLVSACFVVVWHTIRHVGFLGGWRRRGC